MEGLHVDYMNGFGCDYAACMLCQAPGCTQANLANFASVSNAHASFDSTTVTAPVGRNIADCAEEFTRRQLPLHGLINNIGVENPYDNKSKEGFDVRSILCYNLIPCMYLTVISQIIGCCIILLQPTQVSNYLGHFYLTHLLLEKLMETPQSRVVNLTSLVEPNGGIEWTDIG